jgi:DNA repair protein RecN (Recombination protein N)
VHMLAQLVIENLVVIEQATVEFAGRLNVLTGQTGAGKSLLVGAIEALLGLRTAKDLLRAGQVEGRVTGLFYLGDEASRAAMAQLLDEPELPEEVVISRRIQENRSVATVNSRPVSAATMRDVAEVLIDIHGQHEHQYLLKPGNQLDVLTAYAEAEGLAGQVRQTWQTWREAQNRADELLASQQQRIQKIDFYQFQIDEIDNIKPDPQEFTDLLSEHKKLANIERLRAAAGQAAAALSDREEAALDLLRQAAGALAETAKLDPGTANLREVCDEALANLNELGIDLARYMDSLEIDPARLELVENRIEAVRRLCRKYGPNVDDVLAHRRSIGEQIRLLQGAESDSRQLQGQIEAARRTYMDVAGKLSQRRRGASQKLAKAVVAELGELGMEKAICKIELTEAEAGPSGLEGVEFMISANPGLPLRPLRSVASAGELSRIMLGLKSVLAGDGRCSILVFDEVDANVGGRMGSVIGRKLAALAERNQVLCITHLPQIAAYADRHMTVQKTSDARSTRTSVTLLADDRQRVSELAEMIAGKNVTETTVRQAEQLLREARGERGGQGKKPGGRGSNGGPAKRETSRRRRG